MPTLSSGIYFAELSKEMTTNTITEVIFKIALTITLIGCDASLKKLEPQNLQSPHEITLPSGEIVSLLDDGPNLPSTPRLNECVESLCQIEESYGLELEERPYTMLVSENINLIESEKIFDSTIWPQISKVLSEERENSKDANRRTKNLMNRVPTNRSLVIDGVTKVLVKYSVILGRLKGYKWKVHYDTDHFAKTKKLALKESIASTLSLKERHDVESALEVYNKYLTKFVIDSDFAIIDRTGLRVYILYRHGSLGQTNFAQAKENFLREIRKKTDLVKLHSPLFSELLFRNLALQKLFAGEDLSRTEERALKGTLTTLYFFAELIENPWPEFNNIIVDFDSLLQGQKILEKIIDYTEQSIKNENSRHEASAKKVYRICKESISAHIATRPTEEQLANFKKLVPKIIEASKEVGGYLFGLTPQEKIKALADNIEFTLPSSVTNTTKEISREIHRLAKLISNTHMENFDELGPKETENVLALFYASREMAKDKADGEYSRVSDFCLNYIPEGLSDASITVENRIVTSSVTVKSGLKGVGIIAHEVGHRLYRDLENAPNDPIRECLITRHLEKTPPELKLLDRERYLSEDFADQFSSLVLKKLGFTAPENNMACLFFRKERSSGSLVFSSDPKHPMLASEGDNHSSDMFRLLQIAENLSHLTPICQEYEKHEINNTRETQGENKVVIPSIKTCE